MPRITGEPVLFWTCAVDVHCIRQFLVFPAFFLVLEDFLSFLLISLSTGPLCSSRNSVSLTIVLNPSIRLASIKTRDASRHFTEGYVHNL